MESSPKHPSGPAEPERPAAPTVPEQRTVPGAAPPAPGPAERGQGWSRTRLVITVLGGALALLCLGGLGLGYALYDEATEPNRSAPDVAVSNYLRAHFVERDDARIRLYQCANTAGLAALQELRSEIETQEQRLNTSITVSWGELIVDESGEASAVVTTSIRRTARVDGAPQSLVDRWRFRVVEEDGWRVCGAERLP